MKRLMIVFLFIASAASAADYSDLYIIPIAGHTRGAFGTEWRSDVVLHNIQQVPITVEMVLVESGLAPSTPPIDIAIATNLTPGETRTLSDILGTQGRDLTGALIVGAELPFALTSRTYAEHASGRTLGQTVTPVAITDSSTEVSVLAGLSDSNHQRSNLGLFLAASHAPMIAEIQLVSSTGATLESMLITVEEPGFTHLQFVITSGTTAVVRIVEGDGIAVPYASTVDNITAEALFVSGELISSVTNAAATMQSLRLRSLGPVARH